MPSVVNARGPRFYVPVNEQWETAVRSDLRMTAACLLNLIHWKWICKRADDDGFVSLKTEYLRRLIGQRELPTVRQQLADAGVIDWDRTYQEGVRCMGYRLCPEYRKVRSIWCDDRQLTRRIRRLHARDESLLLPVHRWLRERLLLLDFDFDRARSIIDEILPVEKKRKKPLTVTEYRELIAGQLIRLKDQINEGNPGLTCDRFGRVHTAITRLPKSLKCCLTVKGQPLQGIDLANSQPLFLGLVANQYFTDRHERARLRNWTPARRSGRNDRARRTGRNAARREPPITMVEKSQVLCFQRGYENRLMTVSGQELSGDDWEPRSNGLDEYLHDCQAGSLYEKLKRPGEDLARLKKALFTDVLYGRDNYPSQLRDGFHRQYLAIGFMLTELKAGEYCRPSGLMQHKESKLFIGTICNRIKEEQPDIPLVTIHDSLLTTPAHVEYVEAVTRSEFARLGVSPTFHRESY